MSHSKKSISLSSVYKLLEPGPVVMVSSAYKGKSNVMTMSWHMMIEFEPLEVGGKILRRHWMGVYKVNDMFYTIADSKRPGHISKPYRDISDFIGEYESFRNRKIVIYRITETYKKKIKKRLLKKNKQKTS